MKTPPQPAPLPCPWLPAVTARLDPSITRRHGQHRGPEFYRDALAYAQSHWLTGHPAQAILQLNKAWMAEIEPNHPILHQFPPPYHALAWILRHAAAGTHGFLGNPVRHFQHLASRMSGPNRHLRTWRAWLCHHLAAHHLRGKGDFPRDGHQLAREGLWIPCLHRVLNELTHLGWPNESQLALQAFSNDNDPPQ